MTELFYRFGVALFIGFLIGLEREHSHGDTEKEMFAGERTFALIGLIGCLAAFAADILNAPLVFIGVFLLIGVLIAVSHHASAQRGDVGMTTDAAAVITLLAGALCYWNYLALAVALGVATTVILSFKVQLSAFVRRITREDIYATLKFAVVTAIVLPVLPNSPIGPAPFDVLNPHNIWLMVVFICGISFLGFLLIKVVGPRQGIGLTGFLGGLVSSTAVTLSFAQRSKHRHDLSRPFALAVTIAWTMMFIRIMVAAAALNIRLLASLWPAMLASMGAGLLYCVYLYFSQPTEEESHMVFSNPFELGPAIKFGLFYAAILLIANLAQTYFGETGIYISSVFAGMADVNAITLTIAELTQNGSPAEIAIGVRAIVLAAVANTCVKGGIVLLLGSPGLRRAALPGFLLLLCTAIAVAFLLV